MRVAQAFEDGGAVCHQSRFYTDPTTGAIREIDLIANFSGDQEGHRGLVNFLELAIECKQSRDKPWILFTSEHRSLGRGSSLLQRFGTEAGWWALTRLSSDQEVVDLPLFAMPVRAGYGLTQAFTQKQDVAYESVLSAINATENLVRHWNAGCGAKFRGESLRNLAVPVVMIDGLLYECFLKPGDVQPTVQPIDTGLLVWLRSASPTSPIFSIVHIVTVPALEAFVRDAEITASTVLPKLRTVDLSDLEDENSEP